MREKYKIHGDNVYVRVLKDNAVFRRGHEKESQIFEEKLLANKHLYFRRCFMMCRFQDFIMDPF